MDIDELQKQILRKLYNIEISYNSMFVTEVTLQGYYHIGTEPLRVRSHRRD